MWIVRCQKPSGIWTAFFIYLRMELSRDYIRLLDQKIDEAKAKDLKTCYWPVYVHPDLTEDELFPSFRKVVDYLKSNDYHVTDFSECPIPIAALGKMYEIIICWSKEVKTEIEKDGYVFV
jgi:hypothetical protein